MTNETRAWLEKIKEQYSPRGEIAVALEDEALFTALTIIESQEKEIERLKIELMKPCLICATAVYNADLVLPKDRS